MVVARKSLEIMSIPEEIVSSQIGIDPKEERRPERTKGVAKHTVSIRTNGPAKRLSKLAKKIDREIRSINKVLRKQDAMLLPTGCHPFMRPEKEVELWQFQSGDVGQLSHELFDLRTHSWSNVQSAQISVPFANDEEFAKLHAAVRLLLPIIPALSASSPFLEGTYTGFLDSRMEAYLHAQETHPDLMGSMVPEPIYDQESYYREIYGPIGRVLGQHDPTRIHYHQHMNSRGAIPFFERDLLEIRVVDMQEAPSADLAIAEFIVVALKALINGRWVSSYVQRAWPETDLLGIFLQVIKDAGNTTIANRDYLLMFGLLKQEQMQALKLWQHMFVELYGDLSDNCRERIGHILEHGCLASRILQQTGRTPSHEKLVSVYSELADCLAEDRMFN